MVLWDLNYYGPIAVGYAAFVLSQCTAMPVSSDEFGASVVHVSEWQTAIGILMGVALVLSIVVVSGMCLCCNFKRTPSTLGTQNGAQSATAFQDNSSPSTEFTIFPPVGSQQLVDQRTSEDVKFEPLPDIHPRRQNNPPNNQKPRPATFSNVVSKGLSFRDWFEDPYSNFPRTQLQYMHELAPGWFGQVVEGEAYGIIPNQRNTKVVVKILTEGANTTDQMYFLHEVRPFRDVTHPNVLKLLGKCLETDPFLIILEHCAFKDLKSYLIQHRTEAESLFQQNLLLRMICNVAAGLRHLHEHGFILTDLAARNCVVSSDLVVKVGDYGNAIELYKGDYYCAGGIAVPVRWSAPETLRCTETIMETREVTQEANIWSFGVVLWEILEFGKLPYIELNDDELIQKVIIDRTERLKQPLTPCNHINRLYQIIQLCQLSPKCRPSMESIHAMLNYLYCHKTEGEDSATEFETRWNQMQPRRTPTKSTTSTPIQQTTNAGSPIQYGGGDPDSLLMRDMSPSPHPSLSNDSDFSRAIISPSLQNLRGSLDDLRIEGDGQDPTESLSTDNPAPFRTKLSFDASTSSTSSLRVGSALLERSSEKEVSPFTREVEEVIRRLDEDLDRECPSLGEGLLTSDTRMDSSLLSDEVEGDSLSHGASFEDPPEGNSEDEEDMSWKRIVESSNKEAGELTRIIREKSQSVQDFLKLTVIDSESGSDSDGMPNNNSAPASIVDGDISPAVSRRESQVRRSSTGDASRNVILGTVGTSTDISDGAINAAFHADMRSSMESDALKRLADEVVTDSLDGALLTLKFCQFNPSLYELPDGPNLAHDGPPLPEIMVEETSEENVESEPEETIDYNWNSGLNFRFVFKDEKEKSQPVKSEESEVRLDASAFGRDGPNLAHDGPPLPEIMVEETSEENVESEPEETIDYSWNSGLNFRFVFKDEKEKSQPVKSEESAVRLDASDENISFSSPPAMPLPHQRTSTPHSKSSESSVDRDPDTGESNVFLSEDGESPIFNFNSKPTTGFSATEDFHTAREESVSEYQTARSGRSPATNLFDVLDETLAASGSGMPDQEITLQNDSVDIPPKRLDSDDHLIPKNGGVETFQETAPSVVEISLPDIVIQESDEQEQEKTEEEDSGQIILYQPRTNFRFVFKESPDSEQIAQKVKQANISSEGLIEIFSENDKEKTAQFSDEGRGHQKSDGSFEDSDELQDSFLEESPMQESKETGVEELPVEKEDSEHSNMTNSTKNNDGTFRGPSDSPSKAIMDDIAKFPLEELNSNLSNEDHDQLGMDGEHFVGENALLEPSEQHLRTEESASDDRQPHFQVENLDSGKCDIKPEYEKLFKKPDSEQSDDKPDARDSKRKELNLLVDVANVELSQNLSKTESLDARIAPTDMNSESEKSSKTDFEQAEDKPDSELSEKKEFGLLLDVAGAEVLSEAQNSSRTESLDARIALTNTKLESEKSNKNPDFEQSEDKPDSETSEKKVFSSLLDVASAGVSSEAQNSSKTESLDTGIAPTDVKSESEKSIQKPDFAQLDYKPDSETSEKKVSSSLLDVASAEVSNETQNSSKTESLDTGIAATDTKSESEKSIKKPDFGQFEEDKPDSKMSEGQNFSSLLQLADVELPNETQNSSKSESLLTEIEPQTGKPQCKANTSGYPNSQLTDTDFQTDESCGNVTAPSNGGLLPVVEALDLKIPERKRETSNLVQHESYFGKNGDVSIGKMASNVWLNELEGLIMPPLLGTNGSMRAGELIESHRSGPAITTPDLLIDTVFSYLNSDENSLKDRIPCLGSADSDMGDLFQTCSPGSMCSFPLDDIAVHELPDLRDVEADLLSLDEGFEHSDTSGIDGPASSEKTELGLLDNVSNSGSAEDDCIMLVNLETNEAVLVDRPRAKLTFDPRPDDTDEDDGLSASSDSPKTSNVSSLKESSAPSGCGEGSAKNAGLEVKGSPSSTLASINDWSSSNAKDCNGAYSSPSLSSISLEEQCPAQNGSGGNGVLYGAEGPEESFFVKVAAKMEQISPDVERRVPETDGEDVDLAAASFEKCLLVNTEDDEESTTASYGCIPPTSSPANGQANPGLDLLSPQWDTSPESSSAPSSCQSPSSTSSTSGEFDCSKDFKFESYTVQEPENVPVHGESGLAEDYGEYGDDEEEEDDDDDDDDGGSEFKASIWDKNATPTKGLLKSADKRLSSEEKKSVSFKFLKRSIIYEYPKEEVEEEDEEFYEDPNRSLWNFHMYDPQMDYSSYADWELGDEEIPEHLVDVDDFEEGDTSSDFTGQAKHPDHAQAMYKLSDIPDEDMASDYSSSEGGNSSYYAHPDSFDFAAYLSHYNNSSSPFYSAVPSEQQNEDFWLETILNSGDFFVSGSDCPFDFNMDGEEMPQWALSPSAYNMYVNMQDGLDQGEGEGNYELTNGHADDGGSDSGNDVQDEREGHISRMGSYNEGNDAMDEGGSGESDIPVAMETDSTDDTLDDKVPKQHINHNLVPEGQPTVENKQTNCTDNLQRENGNSVDWNGASDGEKIINISSSRVESVA